MMLAILKTRFSEHKELHPDLEWSEVERRLREVPAAIAVLQRMEESGGEPDTIGYDAETGKLIFCDCAKESPAGRRSLCYDEKALQGRAKNPPSGSAERKAKEIGVLMMTEELYRRLQSLGSFDLKTSSWIATPDDIRSQGGALFCERRYNTVFTFHNGADTTGQIPTIQCVDSEGIFLSEYRTGRGNQNHGLCLGLRAAIRREYPIWLMFVLQACNRRLRSGMNVQLNERSTNPD